MCIRQSFLLSILTLLPITFLCGQERSIGIVDLNTDRNNFDGISPISYVLRSATAQPLIFMKQDGEISLRVASAFSQDPNSDVVSFTLSRSSRFSNKEHISENDLRYSFLRCLNGSAKLTLTLRSISTLNSRYELAIEGKTGPEVMSSLLSQCPLLQQAPTLAFGDYFGYGTNVVGVGPYMIRDIRRGRHLVLQLKNKSGVEELPPQKIQLVSTEGDRHSLDLLRSGSLDLFFLQNQEVMEEVTKDETLRTQKCSIYNVVLRRGLILSCDHTMDLVHLNYDYELSSYRKLAPQASPRS